jgi:hypothetical protein
MRGAMYGTWVFPADAEYEFRLRIANFRGGDVVVNSNNGPGRGAGRGAPSQPGRPQAHLGRLRLPVNRAQEEEDAVRGAADALLSRPNSFAPAKKRRGRQRRRAS